MNKSRRILFVAPLPPPVHGSAMVSQQIKDSKSVNEAFCCDWVNLSTSRRMDEIGKGSLAKVFRFVAAFFVTLGKLMTRRYDMCYLAITCYGTGFLKDAPFVLLCKLFGRKIVIHQHNKGMANYVDRRPYRRLLPLVYRKARVILLSWHLYPDIERVVPKENVVICPNGIANTENAHAVHHNATPRLLFLSNLIESKGVLVLLDALKILADKGVMFACDMVGGETKEIDAKRLEKELDKRGLAQVVHYHGRKVGAEKDAFFENSDIFVLPTYYECFPLVLLEAMQHHLPCVTTDEGGIPDIVADGVNGVICERKSATSLANGIKKLLNDEELRVEMGNNGHARYETQFTIVHFENTLIQLLQEA